MHSHSFALHLAMLFSVVVVPAMAELPQNNASLEAVQFFEKKIRPIFINHCYGCHSADTKAAGGLRVDDRHGLLLGGDAGPAVVPGDASSSLILQRIQHENPKRKMPKEGEHLNESQIADLVTWIQNGAHWPQERIPSSLTTAPSNYDELKTNHWAWQPLAKPLPPAVVDTTWPSTPIDQFILAGLESAKLAPVTDADRPTLIRRITFDL
ncbi:MAG TPA: c-type cytochrome domain-containing protein, partial [Chthoniobacteraceae bacterium]|nr:c-type cytochrome domain-containing protein [Chthoniobacteraceae bacterium]